MIDILFVCEGNICRSPYAALHLAHRVADVSGVAVSSAGTHADPTATLHRFSAELLTEAGADWSGFAPRLMAPELLRDRSLVLTMDRSQRGAVLDLAPQLLRRTYTLLEFARLAGPTLAQDRVDAEFWARYPFLLAENRLTNPAADPGDDDIADPVRGGAAAFATMRKDVLPALEVLEQIIRRSIGSAT